MLRYAAGISIQCSGTGKPGQLLAVISLECWPTNISLLSLLSLASLLYLVDLIDFRPAMLEAACARGANFQGILVRRLCRATRTAPTWETHRPGGGVVLREQG